MFEFIKSIWIKNWKGKALLIAAAVIFAGAISGTIYAIITSAGDEGLLLRDGHELKWQRSDLPIACVYDPKLDEDIPLYETARKEINERIGVCVLGPCLPWNLLEAMPEHVFGSITLHAGAPHFTKHKDVTSLTSTETPFDTHVGGTTELRWDKGSGHIVSAAIYMQQTIPDGLVYKAWLHEVLHSLGCDHDRLKSSVMHPILSSRPSKLSEKDVELLRRTYVE